MPQYNCVFKPEQECPVRIEYKLQPENLLGYCTICYINPINEQEPQKAIAKIDSIIVVLEHLPMLLELYAKLDITAKKQLMQLIKTLADIQRM